LVKVVVDDEDGSITTAGKDDDDVSLGLDKKITF
jgi:hypothetical protein